MLVVSITAVEDRKDGSFLARLASSLLEPRLCNSLTDDNDNDNHNDNDNDHDHGNGNDNGNDDDNHNGNQ